eukprot:GHVN01068749.1.p2 GENE.GHVN01068749.1~~GHVN01068749.1.p2  ORF type:complete len:142 (+),score=7.46 GHVN01068749.1:632-1057(+)
MRSVSLSASMVGINKLWTAAESSSVEIRLFHHAAKSSRTESKRNSLQADILDILRHMAIESMAVNWNFLLVRQGLCLALHSRVLRRGPRIVEANCIRDCAVNAKAANNLGLLCGFSRSSQKKGPQHQCYQQPSIDEILGNE